MLRIVAILALLWLAAPHAQGEERWECKDYYFSSWDRIFICLESTPELERGAVTASGVTQAARFGNEGLDRR